MNRNARLRLRSRNLLTSICLQHAERIEVDMCYLLVGVLVNQVIRRLANKFLRTEVHGSLGARTDDGRHASLCQ